jgi:putative flavoprotein involved in K+ transport
VPAEQSVADLVVVGGGQSGLATAAVARQAGLRPVVLEAGEDPVGSWPRYYDSLTLFSPARFSALPGRPFPGDPDRYPTRDEVTDYLRAYAKGLDADIRCGERVTAVSTEDAGVTVRTGAGARLRARLVVAATGSYTRPHRPALPGLSAFGGTVLHSADYREPGPYAGARVVVVGGGNSAVQIATELAGVARVTLATRSPLRWWPQRPLGRDLHWWLIRSGIDSSPLGLHLGGKTTPVLDDGRYRAALAAGAPDRRPLFQRVAESGVIWADGTGEAVDVLLLATGYRPDLDYLAGTGALDGTGQPLHRRGLSTTVPGLGYVGLEHQRSIASATLRGVGRDAGYVLKHFAQGDRRPTASVTAGLGWAATP